MAVIPSISNVLSINKCYPPLAKVQCESCYKFIVVHIGNTMCLSSMNIPMCLSRLEINCK
uniref:Uncharacterized protein n=1 Tax=Lepeophtheirus salmonis TaxID=72036 RepID=A0A0K2UVA1_LEPSM